MSGPFLTCYEGQVYCSHDIEVRSSTARLTALALQKERERGPSATPRIRFHHVLSGRTSVGSTSYRVDDNIWNDCLWSNVNRSTSVRSRRGNERLLRFAKIEHKTFITNSTNTSRRIQVIFGDELFSERLDKSLLLIHYPGLWNRYSGRPTNRIQRRRQPGIVGGDPGYLLLAGALDPTEKATRYCGR